MPSGKVHHQLWKIGRIPMIIIGTSALFINVPIGIGIVIGYYIGDVITPDLDLIGIDRGEAKMIRSVIFIPIVSWSTLYAKSMQILGGHRGFWSHFPIISTFIRLAWFGFPVLALLWTFEIQRYYLTLFQAYLMVGVFIGQTLADTLHWLADIRSGEIRK